MSNDINALRSALFETLQGVKAGTMDIDRAKAINETAQVIINTARAEVDYMKVTGSNTGTDFIPAAQRQPALVEKGQTATATGTKTVTPIAGGSITTHRLK